MNIEIRKGTQQDTEAFIRMLREIREGMEHQEWFFLDTPEKVRSDMESGAMQLWVALDGEQMAGAFSILVQGLAEDNYGHQLGFTEEELMQSINMDTAAVRPEYRGMGLQKRLMEMAEAEIAGEGKRILLCTVHPENCFSLNNVLKQGYAVQKKMEMYGSVRYILRKDIGI